MPSHTTNFSTDRIFGRLEAIDPPSDSRQLLHIWVKDRLLSLCATTSQIPANLSSKDLISFVLQDEENITNIQLIQKSYTRECDDILRWRSSNNSLTRMEMLRLRHKALRTVEHWFDAEDFIQVNIPTRIKQPNPEPQFSFIHTDEGLLSTSPELQMKRMLCGGFEKIMSISSCFRGGEQSRWHNPEFTMLEWYRVGADLSKMAEDLENIWLSCAGQFPAWSKKDTIQVKDHTVQMGRTPWPRISVSDLFYEHLALDIKQCVTAEDLYQRGRAKNYFDDSHQQDSFEVLFSVLWEKIEPNLASKTPLFVCDWPAPLASLARINPDDPTLCDRMELIMGGVELANGFNELLDLKEHKDRFATHNQVRQNRGLAQYGSDEPFLAAVSGGLPQTAGMAMGFDRMCMLLTGAEDIQQLLSFSWQEL